MRTTKIVQGRWIYMDRLRRPLVRICLSSKLSRYYSNMRITVHLNKYYDWDKVPGDVVVTQADIEAKRVKPAMDGGWLMRVAKETATHTEVHMPESQVIAKIVHDKCRTPRPLPVSSFLQDSHQLAA